MAFFRDWKLLLVVALIVGGGVYIFHSSNPEDGADSHASRDAGVSGDAQSGGTESHEPRVSNLGARKGVIGSGSSIRGESGSLSAAEAIRRRQILGKYKRNARGQLVVPDGKPVDDQVAAEQAAAEAAVNADPNNSDNSRASRLKSIGFTEELAKSKSDSQSQAAVTTTANGVGQGEQNPAAPSQDGARSPSSGPPTSYALNPLPGTLSVPYSALTPPCAALAKQPAAIVMKVDENGFVVNAATIPLEKPVSPDILHCVFNPYYSSDGLATAVSVLVPAAGSNPYPGLSKVGTNYSK